jgi:glycosyltransferase involved in cell wall biosynthesis
MARSDIVCIPSLYEACPITMIEAMMLAKPVVVFDRPFSQEMLSGIPNAAMARSLQEYAFQIHSLCTSENLRRHVGRRLREMAIKRFSVEKMAEKYLDVYCNLIS